MEKETKIVIGAIFSVLLIVALGISFAYFMARTDASGRGESVEVQTVTLEKGGKLTVEGKLKFEDLDIYPGHRNVSKIKVTVTGYEDVNYNLIWNGTNSLNTPLKYKVYKSTSDITPTITCNKVIRSNKYYEEQCTDSDFQGLGSPITGTISSSESQIKHILSANNQVTATQEEDVVFYYVVLEYPNLDNSQNLDMEGSFDGIVTAEIIH